MVYVVGIIQVIVAIGLIICVLMQTTKSEGLTGTIGGHSSSTFKTKHTMEERLNRLTTILAIAFMGISLILFLIVR